MHSLRLVTRIVSVAYGHISQRMVVFLQNYYYFLRTVFLLVEVWHCLPGPVIQGDKHRMGMQACGEKLI